MHRVISALVVLASVSWVGAQSGSKSFEVAAISPVRDPTGGAGASISVSGSTLTMRRVTLRECMRWAYGIFDDQISGPGWLSDNRYDIVAKAEGAPSQPEIRVMLQGLLAHRFSLAFHREQKELFVFAMLVGPKGAKVRSTGDQSTDEGAIRASKLQIKAEKATMSQVADGLSLMVRNPVIDMTDLHGRFDFTLDLRPYFTALGSEENRSPDPMLDLVNTVAKGLEAELGLILASRKMPMDVLVVERVDRVPTAN